MRELLCQVHHVARQACRVPERWPSEPVKQKPGKSAQSARSACLPVSFVHAQLNTLLLTPSALLTIAIPAPQAASAAWHQQCRPVSRRYVVAVVDKVEWQAVGSQPQYRRGGSNLWAAHEVLQVLTDRVCAAAGVRLQMESHCYACPRSCCQQRGQAVVGRDTLRQVGRQVATASMAGRALGTHCRGKVGGFLPAGRWTAQPSLAEVHPCGSLAVAIFQNSATDLGVMCAVAPGGPPPADHCHPDACRSCGKETANLAVQLKPGRADLETDACLGVAGTQHCRWGARACESYTGAAVGHSSLPSPSET